MENVESADKVTSQKPKNPGRQEWGRKLGKMSKEFKKKTQASQLGCSLPARWEYVAGLGIFIGALYYVSQTRLLESMSQTKLFEFVKKSLTNRGSGDVASTNAGHRLSESGLRQSSGDNVPTKAMEKSKFEDF